MANEAIRNWIAAEVDLDLARTLARDLSIHEKTARLLVGRGIRDTDAARRYLDPQLKDMPDPFTMKGIMPAAERLADAISNQECVALFGDYDVDGVTSTSLLASFLQLNGLEPIVYIPKRLVEGYGLNHDAVDKLAAEGTQVLVTLDCGITAADEVARANERGIDVIVVDHHRCPPELPPAFATLNPHQDDCAYPDKVLAAVGVCFNLVVALRKVLRDRGVYTQAKQPNLRRWLDLVALGTIADMVPLKGVNRLLTWYGMMELKHAKRPGIRALMEVSKVRPARCSSSDVGFRLGPRINAAGRLDDATIGVRLLLSEDINAARHMAEALDEANGNRQSIERDVFDAACQRIDAEDGLPDAIVLADSTWHPGVVGIVCSKLVERYDRPAILIGEGGRGSARTARGLHLYNAINDCAEFLTKFGGHRAAAGMRIPFNNVDPFRAALLTRIQADQDYGKETEGRLVYDDDLCPEDVVDQWYDEICRLEPFGNGNPQPLFRIVNVRVRNTKIVGIHHLKLRLQEGQLGGLSAIAFKMADWAERLNPGSPIDLAATLDRNEWAGLETLQLRVRDLKLHTASP